ncbi:Glycerophosphodiester phosphodiesterase GDPDL3 [Zea mays]|uniref:glycerophosphodiester phosphodiesterase n=1 Tax=Zea mays TaxID=4577 RepID=A0A1D6Q3U9_MAIZE|nr:Glycerophosphodiester phosphodiesterase GDPDL3 [Zea mays]
MPAMGRSSRACSLLGSTHLLLLLLLSVGSAVAQNGSTWKTLSGKAPAVVAKGGFSGLFPDSSDYAYQFVGISSSPDTTVWCDVRLTKDGAGICLPSINMDNCTIIASVFPQGKKTYKVNGVSTAGWFSVDYTSTVLLQNVSFPAGCFSNLNTSKIDHAKPLVISHNGASGDYPDCTDQAYEKAVADGADVIDCPVQVTKDGILICMSSVDLMDVTTVAKSQFASQVTTINSLKAGSGVFTFNLTWDDISKNLKPMISNPMSTYNLYRNPRNKNAGNFMRLSDFLTFANGKDLSGIMITVEHAAFMAEELGFGVVDAVIKALDDSGYSKQTAQNVMIQSTNSSVLVKFKQETKYNLVYMIEESVRDAAPSSLADIKKFADAVSVGTTSVFPETHYYLTNQTNKLVPTLKSAGLQVYVYVLMNEFASQPNDFFADATSQINAYVQSAKVDGVITDFPGTAHRYKLNSCTSMGKNMPLFMQPPQPGGLLSTILPDAQPPAAAPMPLLTDADVAEPALPPVSNTTTAASPSHAALRMRTHVLSIATLLMLCASLLI